MSIVTVIIVFAVGAYAFFVTIAAVPSYQPGTSNSFTATGIGVLGGTGGAAITNNATNPRFIQCVGLNVAYNSTTGFAVRAYCKATAGGYSAGWNSQSTVNGTIMANNTFRINGGTFFGHNNTFEVTYRYVPGTGVSTYYALKNTTGTGNSVMNVVGIVLLISAIMLIIAVVYTYIGKK